MTPVHPKSPCAGTWAGKMFAFEQRRSAVWDTCHGVGRGLLEKGGEIFHSLRGWIPGQAVASSFPAPIPVPTLQNGPQLLPSSSSHTSSTTGAGLAPLPPEWPDLGPS